MQQWYKIIIEKILTDSAWRRASCRLSNAHRPKRFDGRARPAPQRVEDVDGMSPNVIDALTSLPPIFCTGFLVLWSPFNSRIRMHECPI